MQLFYGTYFILSVVFQLKLRQLLKGSSRKQTRLTNEVVDKLHRVSRDNRQYQRVFKQVIELKFFGRAISNNKKVEKEIKIQLEAVKLTHGQGRSLREIPIPIAADA